MGGGRKAQDCGDARACKSLSQNGAETKRLKKNIRETH